MNRIWSTADLVLLSRDPLQEIGNLDSIEGVVLRGVWLSLEELETARRSAHR